MHGMYIVPVGYMNYLPIEKYNTKVCYCRWFEMPKWHCIKYCLLMTKSCRSIQAHL